MKANIVPTIVLTIICAAAAILLTLAHEATKDSISEQNEAKFSRSVEKLFGECKVTLIDDNFGVSGIEAIAVTSDGKTAVQVTADGYAKDGINILVGIDENGAVTALQDAGVPILMQAYPDEIGKMDFKHRRDAFCGKFSVTE